jgi:hypothetical protein
MGDLVDPARRMRQPGGATDRSAAPSPGKRTLVDQLARVQSAGASGPAASPTSAPSAQDADALTSLHASGSELDVNATPYVEHYDDMLAAVLAARTITDGAEPSDTDAHARVKKLLEPVARRLDQLNDHQGRLAKFGAGNIAGQMALDMAEAAIRSWLRRLALGTRINTEEFVTKFRAGAEPIRFLTGEHADAPTLRAFDYASTLTGIGAGAAMFAPVLIPIVAEEAALLAFVGRVAAQRLAVWALANPAAALAASEALLGFGLQVGEHGWGTFWGQLQDPQARLFIVAQVLMDFMHVRAGMHGDNRSSSARPSAPSGTEPAPDIDVARQRLVKARAVLEQVRNAATKESGHGGITRADAQVASGLALREPSTAEVPGGASRNPKVGKPFAENPLAHVEQKEDNWCGAACGEMAARRLGVEVDQSALAATAHFEPRATIDGQLVRAGGFQTAGLVNALKEVANPAGRRWLGGRIPHDLSTPQELCAHLKGYLSATKSSIILRVSGGNHWIIVDDVLPNGRVVIRDPGEQTSSIVTAQQLSDMRPTGDAVLSFPETR